MGIAKAAIAALEQHHARAGVIEIGDQRFVVFFVDLRAGGHFEDCIGAVRARHFFPHAVAAILGRDVLLESVIDQRIEILRGFRPHIAATPSVATIRATELNELFAAERNTTIPAAAGADIDPGLIEKLHAATLTASKRSRVNSRRCRGTSFPRARHGAFSSWVYKNPSFASTRPDAGLSVM